MATAKSRKEGKDRYVVYGHGSPEVFKTADEAMERMNQINEGLDASAAKSGPKIELLSLDGKPFDGIPTVQATDAVVFTQKANPLKGRPTAIDKTEKDLCALTGYVLVSRNGSGKVSSAWAGPDFANYEEITPAGIVALRTLLNTKVE